ncbi:Hypothetical protein CAP_7126 [Chondromyces apiculatus DSM 436]|uniref:Uncharacterized protein n=1 Tax=Chondromyces apiculatus DSM 436 TaxID=1192034 RepID=A0A017SZV2_9BACT|nr:Hypothetical protein CAP_7126 [Chondromyces apiculatus DSM 436]
MLTEGGARVWAICLRCDARGGRSLRGGWWMVISWIALPILALAAAVALLEWLTRR